MPNAQLSAQARFIAYIETLQAESQNVDFTPVRFIPDFTDGKIILLHAMKQADLFGGVKCLEYWKRR